jgi:hypothetical protein
MVQRSRVKARADQTFHRFELINVTEHEEGLDVMGAQAL